MATIGRPSSIFNKYNNSTFKKKKDPVVQSYQSPYVPTQSGVSQSIAPKAPQPYKINDTTNAYNPNSSRVGQTYQEPEKPVDPIQAIRDRSSGSAQNRISTLTNRKDTGTSEIVNRYAKQKQELESQIPELEKTKDKAIKNFRNQITLQKGQEDTSAGERLAEEAQAYRETQAGLENKFASLGTVDSGGYYGFTGEGSRAASDFNKRQATIRDERDANKKAVEDYYTQLIDTETTNFNNTVRQIQTALANNPEAMNAEIQKLVADFEDKMFEVQQGYDKDASDLDKWYMENQVKNQDVIKAENDAQLQKQSIVDVINSLEGANIGGITGINQLSSYIPGTKAALAKNYYEQLKGLLSLENRQKLKGSGAISDFEARTLEKAASALGRNLSDEQFRMELANLKSALGGSSSQQVGRFIIEEI